MQEPVAWINGSLKPFSQTALPVWDLGVVAGASITEMARTFGHCPFRLERHLQRLMSSCRELEFPMIYSDEQMMAAIERVVEHNLRLISAKDDLGIVAFVTAGTNPTYLGGGLSSSGSTVIHTFPLPFSMWRQSLSEGVRLRITQIRQIPEDCLPISHKIRNRLHWWLADREASRTETGSRALLVDHSDYLTETSTSAVFAVLDGRVVTPSNHVLNSMSRQLIEELLSAAGIPCRRQMIHRSQLADAEEVFLSSTPCFLLPVSQIDGVAVGNGCPGPIFQQLMTAGRQLTGIDIAGQITGNL
jgi:D-alanine transaminase/branched-chain amino acid aminotransferase